MVYLATFYDGKDRVPTNQRTTGSSSLPAKHLWPPGIVQTSNQAWVKKRLDADQGSLRQIVVREGACESSLRVVITSLLISLPFRASRTRPGPGRSLSEWRSEGVNGWKFQVVGKWRQLYLNNNKKKKNIKKRKKFQRWKHGKILWRSIELRSTWKQKGSQCRNLMEKFTKNHSDKACHWPCLMPRTNHQQVWGLNLTF